VNATITFDELRIWFKEEGITLEDTNENISGSNDTIVNDSENSFVPCNAAKGSYYPIDGGMIHSMNKYRAFTGAYGGALRNNRPPHSESRMKGAIGAARYMVVSGLHSLIETINKKTAVPNALRSPLFLELLACEGGCINGPCATYDSEVLQRRAHLLEYAEASDDTLDPALLSLPLCRTGTLTAKEVPAETHTSGEIGSALAETGKFEKEDEFDCSMCGYATCKTFAAAMLEKRAKKTMCIQNMRMLAQKKANALINASPSGIVLVDKNLNIVECNKNWTRFLGSEAKEVYEMVTGLVGINLNKIAPAFVPYFEDAFKTRAREDINHDVRLDKKIFHLNLYVLEKDEIIAGVFDDITIPQIRKDKTVLKARKIIEKNVEAVQKIAFLLGENAAETESILHSIIESHTLGDTNDNTNE
jgi:PAS domain-containing protein